jgi:hypothetical protein
VFSAFKAIAKVSGVCNMLQGHQISSACCSFQAAVSAVLPAGRVPESVQTNMRRVWPSRGILFSKQLELSCVFVRAPCCILLHVL